MLDANSAQINEIGRGAYGVVSLLQNYHPQIVMKEILKNPIINFQKELQVLKELSHPNIVKYVDRPSDISYNGPNMVIFMEYCENGSLKDAITDKTLIYSVATIAKWAQEIFLALVYLFEKKKLHRDIKPANIFLTRLYIIKIGDFGVVKEFEETIDLGHQVGTKRYMAPEVELRLLVEDQEAHKRDVFGAGKVLLELIERKPLSQIVSTSSSMPNDFFELSTFVEKCTRKDHTTRISAKEALEIAELFLKKTTNFESLPERRNNQLVLLKPIGLNGTETEINVYDDETLFRVPDASLTKSKDHEDQAKTTELEVKDENALPLPQKNLLSEWMIKLETNVKFSEILLYNLEVFRDCVWLKENLFLESLEIKNFNEPRKKLAQKLVDLIESTGDGQSKRSLLDELQQTLTANFKLRSALNFTFEDSHPTKYPDLRENLEKVPEFSAILKYDHKIQNACFGFAFFVLRQCQRTTLTDEDTLHLLEIAIQNIEELERIFSRRLYFTVFYVDGLRFEWVDTEPYYHVYIRRDLTQMIDNDKLVDCDGNPRQKIPIDIEAVRRSLYDHREVLKRFVARAGTTHVSLHYLLDELEDQAKEKFTSNEEFIEILKNQENESVQLGEQVDDQHKGPKLEIIYGSGQPEFRLNQLPSTSDVPLFVQHFRDPGFSDPFNGFYFFFKSSPEDAWINLPLARASRILAEDIDGLRKLRNKEITPEQKVFSENYHLFERAWSFLLCYSTIENQLPVLFLIQNFLMEIEERENFSFRCAYIGFEEDDDQEDCLLLHAKSLTSTPVVTRALAVEKRQILPYSTAYLKGYVIVHFSELKALLHSMISLFDFAYYSREIDDVDTEELREEFEVLRDLRKYKSEMKEVIGQFWDKKDLRLAPIFKELESIEVEVPDVSLFPVEYL